MARPESHTAKGLRRREALLEAASDVIAERGYPGVTHRAVAERAGVPVASTSYFFESIDDLVREAAQRYQVQQMSAFELLVGAFTDDDLSAAEACHLVVEGLLALPTDRVLGFFEVYLNARRDPQLQESVATTVNGFEEMAEIGLEAIGARHPHDDAKALVALFSGLMLTRLARPTPDDAEVMEATLLDFFTLCVMDDDERETYARRLD